MTERSPFPRREVPGHPEEGGPVEVFRAAGRKPCKERALVLQALGMQHQIVQSRAGFHLVVQRADADAALAELSQYEQENSSWPPKQVSHKALTDGFVGGALYFTTLITFYLLQHRGAFGWDWTDAGATRAARIREGELWRTVTALTLHSDIVHVLVNLLYGTLFGVLLSHVVGTGVGWLSVLLAGALGNFINAWVQEPTHSSIGASTAVFAALGCLVAVQWSRKYRTRQRWFPVLVGFTILGMYGIPADALTERIDFMAHITGFLAGVLVGLGDVLYFRRRPNTPALQKVAGIAAFGIVLGAWAIALNA